MGTARTIVSGLSVATSVATNMDVSLHDLTSENVGRRRVSDSRYHTGKAEYSKRSVVSLDPVRRVENAEFAADLFGGFAIYGSCGRPRILLLDGQQSSKGALAPWERAHGRLSECSRLPYHHGVRGKHHIKIPSRSRYVFGIQSDACLDRFHSGVAQLVERHSVKVDVPSSSLGPGAY